MKQLKRKSSKVVAFLLAVAMVATSLAYTPSSASAASKKKVTKVSITKPSTKVLVLKKGKTYKMKVKVTASKSKYKKVTYKSSKKAVATVSKSGKIKAVKKGTAKITVTSKTDKKKKATLTVKVGTPITKVTLTGTHGQKSFYYAEVTNVDPESKDYGKVSLVRKSKTTQKRVFTKKKSASVTVTKGEYVQLKANFTPSKASYKKVSYKSSNKKVATVDSYGFVTAKEPGKTTITATAKDGSGKKATVKLTVNEFVETTTPAPTAIPDLSKKTTVENFESYADGTNWDKYTTAGKANPGTMTVVTDPLDPNNKVLKVAYNGPDQAYDFAPYFNVDLSTIPNAKATLGNYKGVKFKVRVVSSNIADVGSGQPKVINGFFADYGTINRDMANSCSYKPDNENVIADPEKFKFLQDWAGFYGEDGESAGSINAEVMNNNRYMPTFNTEYFGTDDAENEIISDPKSRTEGFAGYLNGKAETAEYSAKILNFDRKSKNCQPYLNNSKFDMTFGTTYAGKLTEGQVLEYYLDDIELIEDESGAGQVSIPATSVTLDQEAIELEVGDKRQLTAAVAPEDTTDTITWETSDASIANVADGMVIAVSEGAVTITAKANDNAKATCKVTVKAASKEEVITQVPTTADERWTAAGTDTEDGLQFNMASSDYAGLNINLPAEITDFSRCKSVKFTFKMTDGSSTTDKIKFTIAALNKDASSNWDDAFDDHGRLFETYSDVTYESESQQDNITYDAATGLYTITVSLAGQTNMNKVAALMIARNGKASATATVTFTKIEYTMKAAGEADPTESYPFLAVPFAQDFEDADAITSDTFVIAGGELPVEYKATAGVSGSACLYVPSDAYNGPSALLDNRKGAEDRKYYVECYVKAATDADIDGLVFYYAGYSSYAGFAKGGTNFDQMYLKGDWYKMHDIVTVPAGAFIDLRIRGAKNFLIDNIKIEDYTDQDISDDDYPAKEPASRFAMGTKISADLNATPVEGSWGHTVTATEGGIAVKLSGQYAELKLPLSSPVMLAAYDSIDVKFSSSENISLKYYDEDGNHLSSLVRYSKKSDTTTGRDTWAGKVWNDVDVTTKIAYVGLMANDGAVDDLVVTGIVANPATKIYADLEGEPVDGTWGQTVAATEGGIAVKLSGQYAELKLALPTELSLAEIDSITAEFSSTANIALKYYDADGNHLGSLVRYSKTSDTTTGRDTWAGKVWNDVDVSTKVKYVGFMANDGAVDDLVITGLYATPATTLYADLTAEGADGTWGQTVAATEGGIALQLSGQYAELKLALPVALTLAEMKDITVKFSSDANIAFKYYDADGNQIAALVRYSKTSDTTTGRDTWEGKVWNDVDLSTTVGYVGIMANDGAVNAVINSIEVNKNVD